MNKAVKWVLGVIIAAIIGWIVTSLLDGSFIPLTEQEIVDIINNMESTPLY